MLKWKIILPDEKEISDIKRNMTTQDITEVMSGYTLTNTGTAKFNSYECEYMTFEPYRNAVQI